MKPSLMTGFFAIWKSLKARGNYRLSPIPVLILYDVQSSQTVQLFLLLFLSFCVYPTSVLYQRYP
ncbi:hypothetical protein AVO52_09290 [Vibrio cholerae]|nr:hypothetical protein AVO52_09290 [Vibrio cholerae]